jgi:hypothetical protein
MAGRRRRLLSASRVVLWPTPRALKADGATLKPRRAASALRNASRRRGDRPSGTEACPAVLKCRSSRLQARVSGPRTRSRRAGGRPAPPQARAPVGNAFSSRPLAVPSLRQDGDGAAQHVVSERKACSPWLENSSHPPQSCSVQAHERAGRVQGPKNRPSNPTSARKSGESRLHTRGERRQRGTEPPRGSFSRHPASKAPSPFSMRPLNRRDGAGGALTCPMPPPRIVPDTTSTSDPRDLTPTVLARPVHCSASCSLRPPLGPAVHSHDHASAEGPREERPTRSRRADGSTRG